MMNQILLINTLSKFIFDKDQRMVLKFLNSRAIINTKINKAPNSNSLIVKESTDYLEDRFLKDNDISD